MAPDEAPELPPDEAPELAPEPEPDDPLDGELPLDAPEEPPLDEPEGPPSDDGSVVSGPFDPPLSPLEQATSNPKATAPIAPVNGDCFIASPSFRSRLPQPCVRLGDENAPRFIQSGETSALDAARGRATQRPRSECPARAVLERSDARAAASEFFVGEARLWALGTVVTVTCAIGAPYMTRSRRVATTFIRS
jgi:hypothetical protein